MHNLLFRQRASTTTELISDKNEKPGCPLSYRKISRKKLIDLLQEVIFTLNVNKYSNVNIYLIKTQYLTPRFILNRMLYSHHNNISMWT